MSDHSLQGAITRKGDIVHGWCWSVARPYERLQVSLLINGERLATTRAGRLRSELIRPGICDGYHGFSLVLPADLSFSALIEVQDYDSGVIFGRIAPYETSETHVWRAEAERGFVKAAALQEDLAAALGQPKRAALARALGEMGRQFRRAPSPMPMPTLCRGLRLPNVLRPRMTLLLDTAFDAEGASRSVLAAAPLLRHSQAELIVSDDGHSTLSASLASLNGLRYCFTSLPPGAARAHHAVNRARGDTLVFLRAGAVSSRGLAELLDAAKTETAVLVGSLAQVNAQQAGLCGLFGGVAGDSTRSGLSLLVPRATFLALGRFDPAMEDGADLPVLDFALRAREAGHAIVAWRDNFPTTLNLLPQAAYARERFITCWGPSHGNGKKIFLPN